MVFAVGPILDASGLIRSVKIQPRARGQHGRVTIMLIGSLGLMVFGFIVSLRFRLNRDTHTVLMDEIERFKKQPGTQPTAENRAIVEDLTGWKYEELWGKGRRALKLRADRIVGPGPRSAATARPRADSIERNGRSLIARKPADRVPRRSPRRPSRWCARCRR